MSPNFSVAPQVFAHFPAYRRGVVIARGITNGPSQPDLAAALRAAEAELAARLTPETITAQPRILAWREAYRSIGVKPADFRPSVEALVRRVVRRDPLPLINRIVDLGNLVSIRRLIPIGAHSIDVIHADMELRLAAGDESFEPFGSDALEHPNPGEIIFAEGQTVLCRRWTWRQARHTLVLPETTAVEINIDALPPVTDAEVVEVCEELAALVTRHCGGAARWAVASQDQPSIPL